MFRWLTALCLLFAGPAWSAQLDLRTVGARKQGDSVPAASRIVARELRSQGYTHFTVEQQRRMELDEGERGALKLPNGKTLHVRLLGEQPSVVRVRIRLVEDQRVGVEWTVTLPESKPLLVRVGQLDGAELIVAVVLPGSSSARQRPVGPGGS